MLINRKYASVDIIQKQWQNKDSSFSNDWINENIASFQIEIKS
jgi:hypothetical protein